MDDLLGWVGLSVALGLTLLLSARRPSLAVILLVAVGVRAMAALFHFYVTPLPDGTTDAVTFEQYAWQWSRDGFSGALSHYPGLDADFYSWLMSLVYATTGRSMLLLQSLSVMVGVFGVYATWHLAREIWDGAVARKAAWVVALFPTVVMYGALTLREAYVVLFLLLGLKAVARWAHRGGLGPVIWAMAAFGAGSFFHGGIFVAIIGLVALVGFRQVRRIWLALTRDSIQPIAALALLAVAGLLSGYAVSGLSVHKIGTASQLVSPDRWIYVFETRTYGVAAYPDWTMPQSTWDLVWAVPLRAIYLLFAPFPWDVDTPKHLVGLFDGLLYLSLTIVIWRYRTAIWANEGARAILIVVTFLVFAYGVGAGNFGTGLRHRAKIVAALVVLAAPFLPGFRLPRTVSPPRMRTSHSNGNE